MRNAGFHESTAGNQGKTLGFKARALVFQKFMLWDLRGAEHFFQDKRPHKEVLTPGLENRAAGMSTTRSKTHRSNLFGHIPFPGKLSQGSTASTGKPIGKQIDLRPIGRMLVLLLYQGQEVW